MMSGPDRLPDLSPADAGTIAYRHGVRVLHYAADGAKLSSDEDAVELIGRAYEHAPDMVAIPTARIDDRFFDLSTRIAGEVLQKFVTYRLRVVIVGDISHHLAGSAALRDFVDESNRGRHVWFVADDAQLDAQLLRARE